MPMIRTQVYLPQDLYTDMRFFASQHNTTISKIIREGAKNVLAKKKRKKKNLLPLENIVGTLKGGPKDLATNHDYYLYDEPYK